MVEVLISSYNQDEESLAIRNKISEHESAISGIEEDIAGLQSDIRRLTFKRREHLDRILEYKSLISLVRKLPRELLVQIFEHCIRNGWTRAPIILSHVCSHWRAASMIPSIWSHVHITSATGVGYAHAVERTTFWLERAGSVPLHITLHIEGITASLQDALNQLSARSAQWKSMAIDAHDVQHVNQTLLSITAVPSNLETLRISVSNDLPDGASIPNTTAPSLDLAATQTWPSLTALLIDRNDMVISYQNVSSTLQHLSLNFSGQTPVLAISLVDLMNVLHQVPLLQSFSLKAPEARGFRESPDATLDSIELLELKRMSLIGDRGVFQFLDKIDTPSLTHLHLRSSFYVPSSIDPGACVEQFIRRCNPPLQSLELHDIDINNGDLSSCLSQLASLCRLRLHESEISDEVLLQLHSHPNLAFIDLRWCGNITGAALVELTRRRSMHEVAVINCSHVREADIVQLAKLTICRVVIRKKDH